MFEYLVIEFGYTFMLVCYRFWYYNWRMQQHALY